MTRKYLINVEVTPPMGGQRVAFNSELDPALHEEFKPIRTADEVMPIELRMATHELTEREAKPMRVVREDLAKYLAAKIAESLVQAMEAEDTHNGYLKSTPVAAPEGS